MVEGGWGIPFYINLQYVNQIHLGRGTLTLVILLGTSLLGNSFA